VKLLKKAFIWQKVEINKNVFVEDLNKDNYPMKIWSNVALVFFRGMKKTSQT